MKKIIVTSDLSDRSRAAVRRAVDLAIVNDANLVVISVVSDDLPSELVQPVQIGASTMLSEQVTSDAKDRPIRFDVRVEVGDPKSMINDLATRLQGDLLVVGPHRRRKFLDEIRETTVEHVIRSSRIPILLVAGDTDAQYANVLCGTAYSKVCTAALQLIPKVAPDAQLSLFHAHDPSFRQESGHEFETWKAVFGLPSDTPEPIYVEASARDATRDLLAEEGFDLLAIGGHTREDGGRYFTGRFTAGLIRIPPCDLLIAK